MGVHQEEERGAISVRHGSNAGQENLTSLHHDTPDLTPGLKLPPHAAVPVVARPSGSNPCWGLPWSPPLPLLPC